MYKLPETSIIEQPEHISIADKFANEMIQSFQPEELNEIMLHIIEIFKERREFEIAETQMKLQYLQESMKPFNSLK